MAPTNTTGLSLFTVKFRKKAVSSIVSVPNVANLAATVLVNVTGTATITLASTENNVTLTEAAIVIQKLN